MEIKRKRGRPKKLACREALMDVGRDLLLSFGIRLTIDALVAKTGVAKSTFYTYFKDKEAFIELVLLRESSRTVSPEDLLLAEHSHTDSVELYDVLYRFGVRYLRFANEQRLMGWDRLIASAYDIYPELAKRLYDAGPGRGYAMLATILRNAAARGLLHLGDPAGAAEDLSALWYGNRILQINLRVLPAMSEEEITHRAKHGVDTFYRLYG